MKVSFAEVAIAGLLVSAGAILHGVLETWMSVAPLAEPAESAELSELFEPPSVAVSQEPPSVAGAYDRDPETGQLLGWPDNMGIDETTFREDCTDVCAAPWFSVREDAPEIRQRVLYANHEHLVCVCLRASGTVQRYVGWQLR